MRRLMKQARKRIRFPQLKQLKTLKLDEKVAILEASKNATHFEYFLKLSTLEKGKPIYLPLNRNPYLDECLMKGVRKPFVQLRLDGKKCVISAIVEYDKALCVRQILALVLISEWSLCLRPVMVNNMV